MLGFQSLSSPQSPIFQLCYNNAKSKFGGRYVVWGTSETGNVILEVQFEEQIWEFEVLSAYLLSQLLQSISTSDASVHICVLCTSTAFCQYCGKKLLSWPHLNESGSCVFTCRAVFRFIHFLFFLTQVFVYIYRSYASFTPITIHYEKDTITSILLTKLFH